MLLVANHTAWWDPLVVLWLVEDVCALEGYALMEARNLRRLPFFGLVGGFGVDLDRPGDGAAAVRHAARLLDRPGRVVLFFPQGRERPVTVRPLGFRGGSVVVARAAPAARTVPLALRYEFGEAERPEVWCAIGAPVAADAHEPAVAALLDATDAAIRTGGAGFETLLAGRPRRLAALAERALVAVTRPFASGR